MGNIKMYKIQILPFTRYDDRGFISITSRIWTLEGEIRHTQK